MVQFDFLIRPLKPTHVHSDIEFFYVLEGSTRFTMEDKDYFLRKNDFLVVNIDKSHSYTADDDFLAATMHISYSELSRMLKQNMVFFWANTAVDNTEACEELRGVFRKIVSQQYQDGNQNVIYLNALYYEFLNILTTDFLLSREDVHYGEEVHKFDARKHEIEEFIRLNFDKPISLEDLSKQLYLSYAYLSKYIKKQFGVGFAEYLNVVRLNYAVSQLLHSDQPVVRIAMSSGFASSAALNKAFKDRYGTTPAEYRKRYIEKKEQTESSAEEEKQIKLQLKRHFAYAIESKHIDKKQFEDVVTLQGAQKKILKKNWCRMINMGTAMDLLQSDMQQQVLYLKSELHFEYVRFWDIYNPEMYLDIHNKSRELNFDNLDRVLDFLIRNGLKPYIELRPKPKKVLKNKSNRLIYQGNAESDPEWEDVEIFMRKLIVHLLNRYNSEQLETWYFELWNAEPEEVLLAASRAQIAMPSKEYLDLFEFVSGLLKEYLPTIKVGGGGFSLRYGENVFKDLLEGWKKRRFLPDFVSIYSYPYSQDSIDKERNQSKKSNFLLQSLTQIHQIMDEIDFPVKELHVSEWNFSVSNRNRLNDHCMKGAYLVKDMIDGIDMADLLGYWVGSDLYASYYDTNTILNGSGGLLSKDGIRKPAFFAFYFMNRLGKYVRKRGENYIITDNGAGNWRIVCHNLKGLNHQYSLLKEDEITLEEQNNLFTDLKKRRMHFELMGKKNGKYLIRIYSVNSKNGSLQDEWMDMSTPKELSRDDLVYLSRITTPRLLMLDTVANNGKIVFDIDLEPNEICFIHVTYQYA